MGNQTRRVVIFAVSFVALISGGLARSASAQIVADPASVRSVVPARLADTRKGHETIDGAYAQMGRPNSGSHTLIQIAGRGNVPRDATAALLNLTGIQPARANVLTVYPAPCAESVPQVSSLNSSAKRDTANGVFAPLGENGFVCVYTAAQTDFAIDITAYVPSGAATKSVTPARLVDTRVGSAYKTIDGAYRGRGKLTNNSHNEIKIAGRGNVPAGATAAYINLTAVRPTENTYLTVYPGPCGTASPSTSNLNAPTGADTANNALVQLGPNGTICVYTVRETDIVIDLNGYVAAGGPRTGITPARLADTRNGTDHKTVDGQQQGGGPRGENSFTEVPIAGRGGIPTNATAAVLNLTGSQPAQDTYITAYPGPCTNPLPNVSTLNLPAKTDRANSALVQLGPNGTICVYTVHTTDIIIDATGYMVSPPSFVCPTTGTIPLSECQALVALYNHTNGNNWQPTGWLTRPDPCTWQRLICEGGHVTELNLTVVGASGAIPPEIGALTRLRIFTAFGGGPIPHADSSRPAGLHITRLPAEIGNLTNLTSMDLSYNFLRTVPPQIGNLSSLRDLNLSWNNLTTLPVEIGKLNNLDSLRLNSNQLFGDVTNVFSPMMTTNKLTTLDLANNTCLVTGDPRLAAWLTARSPTWNDCG